MVGSWVSHAAAVAVVLGSVLVSGTGAGAIGAPSPPGTVDQFVVTTGADDGSPGTFRAALEGANGSEVHEIIVDPSVRTITLDDCADGRAMMEATDAGTTTIFGNGATVVQTCVGAGVFGSVAALDIHDLTVTGGFAYDSGGGLLLGGTSVLEDVTVIDNVSAGTGGGIAGQDVTLIRSTVAGNRARFAGGGVSGTSVTVDTSTISGNAAELGSGIASAGPIALSFATVTSNDEGPNLLVGGELTSFGSAVGLGGANCVFSPIGSTRSLGYNVQAFVYPMDQPAASCGLDGPTDRTIHPWLSSIGDHGGPTATKVPRSGSALIDAIPASEPTCTGTDQRGIQRPLRGACDIGAVEVRTPVARDAALSVPAGGELAIDLRSLVDDPDEVLGTYAIGAPAHGSLFPTVTGYTGPNCQTGPDDIEDGGPVTLVCRALLPPGPGAPIAGSLFPRGLGVISYIPATGYAGPDAVTFVLCSEGDVVCTETRTIAITVTAVAPTPVPVEPRFTG